MVIFKRGRHCVVSLSGCHATCTQRARNVHTQCAFHFAWRPERRLRRSLGIVRRGLQFIVLIREDLKVITVSKCYHPYKGSTFSSAVILIPWVMVRQESNSRPPASQPDAQPTEPPVRWVEFGGSPLRGFKVRLNGSCIVKSNIVERGCIVFNEAVKRTKQVGFNIWTREPFDQNIHKLLRKEMRAILLCPKNVSVLGIRAFNCWTRWSNACNIIASTWEQKKCWIMLNEVLFPSNIVEHGQTSRTNWISRYWMMFHQHVWSVWPDVNTVFSYHQKSNIWFDLFRCFIALISCLHSLIRNSTKRG